MVDQHLRSIMQGELHEARPYLGRSKMIEFMFDEMQEIAGLSGLIGKAGFRQSQHPELLHRIMRHLFQPRAGLLCCVTRQKHITAHQPQHDLVQVDEEFEQGLPAHLAQIDQRTGSSRLRLAEIAAANFKFQQCIVIGRPLAVIVHGIIGHELGETRYHRVIGRQIFGNHQVQPEGAGGKGKTRTTGEHLQRIEIIRSEAFAEQMAHALQFTLFQQCAGNGKEHGFIRCDHVLRKPHDDLAKPVDAASVDQFAAMGAFKNLRGMGLITAVEQHRHGRERMSSLFKSRCDLHHGAAGLQGGETFSRSQGEKPY
ncbi:hypothetical protein D3C78_789690 [compost metagenome]